MKVNYQFAAETVEIEVTEEWGEILVEMDRKEYNNNHKETRRHSSIDALVYEDARFFDSGIDVAKKVSEICTIQKALNELNDRERWLISKIRLEGHSYTEIARSEKKSPSTILRETQKAVDKFKRLYADAE